MGAEPEPDCQGVSDAARSAFGASKNQNVGTEETETDEASAVDLRCR